ncbi:RluA family pseudouridine synthase [Vibrio neptunius]|uniref:RNA pseudouridine synthase n=1 Tax=Vibrio neptunius TaxID=170651 RepID=A0ABS3A5B8_9VIBR|nr:RluA family pseudouridine synthase [Vibrio neptunius]MBN3494681.1 RNA pseudouridine synthase [Vibrio neptunius]MBN3517173.1 RNA pseudouridine synthase [Vibrio neptunius]MBN3551277.1 RNA pseudouridine synthase [Vibrio neptunius]MBN3579568.1 RNA pseudouridine synthase [Vibrio neptunius]MCH9873233.1 RNA pseudouridine synthase [Vibrio neptunius]
MHQPENLFTPFNAPIDGYRLPDKFTFPFFYQPHPLCELAAQELQQYLADQTHWQHNFGIDGSQSGTGKMFGVLLVESLEGKIGYLSAFSGKIADKNILPGFVPPVFDMLAEESFFRAETAEIMAANKKFNLLKSNPRIAELTSKIKQLTSEYQQQEQLQRESMIAGRAERKAQRKLAESSFAGEALQNRLDELAKQSVAEKNVLKYLKLEWDDKIAVLQHELDELNINLNALKEQRKTLSNTLQNKLFDNYRFLNIRGEEKSLNAIFKPTNAPVPPAGAGECAAPKLLHFAFKHGFKPLALAEFWWGVSPKSEVRQHGKFYPSCQSKCFPILGHMLKGMDVDDNPLEENWAEDKELEILFEDEAMVVINKPSGLLSVPGKTIKDSAHTRLQQRYPDVEGPFVIHRLDMATSGLLVFALTKRANKSLQKQFISRSVQKRYIALLEGAVSQTSGQITLPMRGDPDDRPRQLICFEHGKPAETYWELIETRDNRSKLYLYPKTGRTHQLRVHCAHHLGLNLPMVGDGLYGQRADRLHLHAQRLKIEHPYTKQPMTFEADSEF